MVKEAFYYTPKISLAECTALLASNGASFELENVMGDSGRRQSVYKNMWPNLGTFWQLHAHKWRAREYIVFEDGTRWTYGDILRWSAQIAELLRLQYDVKQGDRGAFHSDISAV
jgi:hypothetical protein